jgi:hypothetical protein
MKNLISTPARALRVMMSALGSAITSFMKPREMVESCWRDAVLVAAVVLVAGGVADAIAAAA